MSKPGSYDPHAVELKIYEFWERGGYFHAEPDPARRPYVIDIPLPNVTGSLHLGHALNNTLQDLLIRYKRMCGYNAMWMPGTDHAGIATQAVVEKRLREEEGLTRHQVGREGLVQRIWAWKEKFGGRILEQLRRMGCSCDWQRTRFTLDEVCARAVYEVFFRWFKAGLIYRGLRLVNWDAHLQTAVADDEIIHETVQGHLWHYRYPILAEDEVPPAPEDPDAQRRLPEEVVRRVLARATRPEARLGQDYVVIATTRPETMLGDTAVAVHSDDRRYRHLIGRYCLLPLMDRTIPIIADDILVDPEFGTGCVKVTPGHDPNDYDFSERHGMAKINILAPDGRINENGGKYAGLDRYEARDRVVADLEALGLMEKVEPYETEIGHSDRSKTPIEPMLSEQWFVRMPELCELAMEAVRDGRVRFFPRRYEQMYLDWLGEKRDWCISRQLWWGHRIPVWSFPVGTMLDAQAVRDALDELLRLEREELLARQGPLPGAAGNADSLDDGARALLLSSYWSPRPDFQRDFSRLAERLGLQQDPDVLDTWFSSALWPFSTLGWPHDHDGQNRERQRPAGQGAVAHAPGSDQAGARIPGDDRSREREPADSRTPTLADFEYFFPTSTLVTARGIITLWVARMVMTALYFTRRVPFAHVYIHPIIQDGLGRTMSKSLGNGVDPLDIIELYGADAMRFCLAQMATETQDVRMPVKPVQLPDGRTVNSSEKFELGRNFCNKLWQAATGFILPNLQKAAGVGPRGEPGDGWPQPLKPEDLAVEDRWILLRLCACIAEVTRRFDSYQINEAANTLHSFFWGDFCDWYIELVKPRLYADSTGEPEGAAGLSPRGAADSANVARQVLAWVLDQSLRLLHPIVPFITEELWQRLNAVAPRRGITTVHAVNRDSPGPPQRGAGRSFAHDEISPALIVARWPDAEAWTRDEAVQRQMEALMGVIRGLREIRTYVNAIRSAGGERAIRLLPRAVVRATPESAEFLRQREPMILRLGQCEQVEIGPQVAKPPESASKVLRDAEVYVPLTGLADLEIERRRLRKQCDELAARIRRSESRLADANFTSKAPAAVVRREHEHLAELRSKLAAVERHLAELP